MLPPGGAGRHRGYAGRHLPGSFIMEGASSVSPTRRLCGYFVARPVTKNSPGKATLPPGCSFPSHGATPPRWPAFPLWQVSCLPPAQLMVSSSPPEGGGPPGRLPGNSARLAWRAHINHRIQPFAYPEHRPAAAFLQSGTALATPPAHPGHRGRRHPAGIGTPHSVGEPSTPASILLHSFSRLFTYFPVYNSTILSIFSSVKPYSSY